MTTDFALQQQIIAMADLVTPMTVRVAVTLRLADHVGETGISVAELAERTGTRPRPLGKLLNHLAHLNFLESSGDHYRLTELGAALRRENGSPGPFDQLDLDNVIGRTEVSAIHLLHKLRTGKSVYDGMYGTDLWSYVDGLDGAREALRAQVGMPPGFDIDVLVGHPALRDAATVVDVGGNTGALVEALLVAYPGLRATLVDLPAFADVARERFAAAGLSERAEALGRNFFDPLPAGADAYVLSAVLADWDDDAAVRLLRNCAQAAGEEGRILVSEVCLTEQLMSAASGMALWFEAIMENPDRTAEEITDLAGAAGLKPAGVERAATRMVLEFHA